MSKNFTLEELVEIQTEMKGSGLMPSLKAKIDDMVKEHSSNPHLQELENLKVAYAHFTLREWNILARAVQHLLVTSPGSVPPDPYTSKYHPFTMSERNALLAKMPSVVL